MSFWLYEMCEMCVTVIYFLLVKLIKFFSLSFYILLPVMVNKDFHIYAHTLRRRTTTFDRITKSVHVSRRSAAAPPQGGGALTYPNF